MAQSQEPKPKATGANKSVKSDQRGTPKLPLVIEIIPTEDDKKEASENAGERKEKLQLDRNLVRFTQDLRDLTGVLAAIGIFQLIVFGYQAWKLRQTVEVADAQAIDTQRSIVEAGRAATAMENVAAATKRNTELLEPMLRKQMRAYIAIDTGGGTFQDANNRFAGTPVMNNTGLTPARNVSYSVNAAILTIENIAPNDLVIPAVGPIVVNDAGIAPRQQFTIQGVVNETFPANEVQEIMLGQKRRLFVWGIVTYDDVFGGHWWTKFCHNHIFYMGIDNTIKVSSYYHSTHNDAT